MRPTSWCVAAVVWVALTALSGCAQVTEPELVPADRFYFPTGLAHSKVTGSANGILYVASSNFDRRYDDGSVLGVRLDDVRAADGTALPAPGAAASQNGPVQLVNLGIDPESAYVRMRSFAGEIGLYPGSTAGGPVRLFIPSRAEGELLHVVDADGAALSCVGTSTRSCGEGAVSLDASKSDEQSQPRAPEPFGVAVAPTGRIFVTHQQPSDRPLGSGKELHSYLVTTDANNPVVDESSFIDIGPNASSSIALGSRYAYVTGYSAASAGTLLRLVDQTDTGSGYLNPQLEGEYQVPEARGVALDPSETRLFIAGREPDSLIVVDVQDAASASPRLRLSRAVPLPAEPNAVRVIPRAGRGSLVAVASSGAGSVLFYDDDIGQLVAQVQGVGSQPFSIAVDSQGAFARLYVSNFGDGRVAVVDVELAKPQQARLVAHLGAAQTCLVEEDVSCE